MRDLNVSFAEKLQQGDAEQQEEEEGKEAGGEHTRYHPGRRAAAVSPPHTAGAHALSRQQVQSQGAAASQAGARQQPAGQEAGAAEEELGGVAHQLHLLHRDPPLQPLQVGAGWGVCVAPAAAALIRAACTPPPTHTPTPTHT
jgi:hypothetical protein